MRLPSQDSSTGRALKTAVQAVIGFAIGLLIVVWNVPGVPYAVQNYIQGHIVEVLLAIGLPAGLTSLVWNFFRKDVPDY